MSNANSHLANKHYRNTYHVLKDMVDLACLLDREKPKKIKELEKKDKKLKSYLKDLEKDVSKDLIGLIEKTRSYSLMSFARLDKPEEKELREQNRGLAERSFLNLHPPLGFNPKDYQNEDDLYARYLELLKEMLVYAEKRDEEKSSVLEDIKDLNRRAAKVLGDLRIHISKEFDYKLDLAKNKCINSFYSLSNPKRKEFRDESAKEAHKHVEDLPKTIPKKELTNKN